MRGFKSFKVLWEHLLLIWIDMNNYMNSLESFLLYYTIYSTLLCSILVNIFTTILYKTKSCDQRNHLSDIFILAICIQQKLGFQDSTLILYIVCTGWNTVWPLPLLVTEQGGQPCHKEPLVTHHCYLVTHWVDKLDRGDHPMQRSSWVVTCSPACNNLVW